MHFWKKGHDFDIQRYAIRCYCRCKKRQAQWRPQWTFARENASLGRDYPPGTAPREKALISDHPVWFLSVSEFVGPAVPPLCPPELVRFSMWGGERDSARAKVWMPEWRAQLCLPVTQTRLGPLWASVSPSLRGTCQRTPRGPALSGHAGPGRVEHKLWVLRPPLDSLLPHPHPLPQAGHRVSGACAVPGINTMDQWIVNPQRGPAVGRWTAPRWQPSNGAAEQTPKMVF